MEASRDGHWTQHLSAYLDDELGAGETRALEQHLISCASCRRELEELRRVVDRLREPGASSPPAISDFTLVGNWRQIERQLDMRASGPVETTGTRPSAWPVRALVAGILLTIGATSGYWIGAHGCGYGIGGTTGRIGVFLPCNDRAARRGVRLNADTVNASHAARPELALDSAIARTRQSLRETPRDTALARYLLRLEKARAALVEERIR